MGLKDTLDRANQTIIEQASALNRAEQAEKRLREEIRSAIDGADGRVEEVLASVQAMFAREDRGWSLFDSYLGDEEDGLMLEDLKHWSWEIRQAVVGNPHIGRGYRFRRNYIWRDGIKLAGIPKGGRGGASSNNVQQYIDDSYNKRHFFGEEAHAQRELAMFADGIYVAIGDKKTKRIRTLPLRNITGILRDPDNHDEIWAYRHSWIRQNADGTPGEYMHEWVFVDMYLDKQTPTVNALGLVEKVNRNQVAFDLHPNRAHGWALGAPDAIAALMWSRIVRNLVMDGVSVTAAMAKLFAQVTVPSKQAAQSAAAALASITEAGATAISGSQVNPLSTAGRGYDFSSFRPVIAIMASAMDVPITALTSDTAGAGMGSAVAALDEPTQYAMEERRQFHLELEYRVLRWLGQGITNFKPKAHFKPLMAAADKWRAAQGINANWETGLWTPQQTKAQIMALDGYDWEIDNWQTIPADVMIPNNQDDPDSLTNDAQGDTLAQQAKAAAQAAKAQSDATANARATGQGQSNPPSVGKIPQDKSTRMDQ